MLLALILAQASLTPIPDVGGPIYSMPSATSSSSLVFEFAPASGLGMGSQCACTAVTGTKGETLTVTRTSSAECISNDGQAITQCSSGAPRISSGAVDRTILGEWEEPGTLNDATWNRDMSNGVWVASNVTCVRNANGMRSNDANGASTCTATANGGTVLQTITFANSGYVVTVFAKRRVGTGTVSITINGGSTWIDITAGLSASEWRRAVYREVAGCTSVAPPTNSKCIVRAALSGTAAGAVIGVQFGTAGDAVDFDFWQSERSSSGLGLSTPIETTSAAAARTVEYPDLTVNVPSTTILNGWCMTATTVGPLVGLGQFAGALGDGAIGNAAQSIHYIIPGYSGGWNAVASSNVMSPTTSATGVTTTAATMVNHGSAFYDGAKLNGCLNGVCGAGTTATYTPFTITRWRVGLTATVIGDINGVQSQFQLATTATGCAR